MYEFNGDSARKAESTGSFIKEMGKYVGVITQAEDVTAKTGTKGIAFTFESGGQKADFTLYTKKENGEKVMGFDQLMSIMGCLKVRSIKPEPGTVTSYNFERREDVKRPATVFSELCGKSIGILFHTEDYANKNGELRTKLGFSGAFQAGTELTAAEMLDSKTKPEQLAKMVAYLRHRPLNGGKTPAHTPSASNDGFDSDGIPWN